MGSPKLYIIANRWLILFTIKILSRFHSHSNLSIKGNGKLFHILRLWYEEVLLICFKCLYVLFAVLAETRIILLFQLMVFVNACNVGGSLEGTTTVHVLQQYNQIILFLS